MKRKFLVPALSSLLLAGCSMGPQAFDDGSDQKDRDTTLASDQSSTGDLYIGDTVESAGSEEGGESVGVDSSVKDDLRTERLTQMAANLIKDLDADSSGLLSLDEFLALPETLSAKGNRPAPSAEMLEHIKAKLTEEFGKFAGDDNLLSSDELIALLTAQAPRVAHFRGKHRRGGQGGGIMPPPPPQGPDQDWDSILAKYDADGDKVLNQAEFEAFMQDHQPRGVRRRMGPPPRRGGPQGGGEQGFGG